MRNNFKTPDTHDSRINYRGEISTRIEYLTDAVFGIAITLLIFNPSNVESFQGILDFTKTLPALMVSILFLFLFWKEHVHFADVYGLKDKWLSMINTLFIALIIFYVYPLRFLTLFLTSLFFEVDLHLSISYQEVPQLMYYYGIAAFLLYFAIFLLYGRAWAMRNSLELTQYELMYTKHQRRRIFILLFVPLLSVLVTFILTKMSIVLAPMWGGLTYWLYIPGMIWWNSKYEKAKQAFIREEAGNENEN